VNYGDCGVVDNVVSIVVGYGLNDPGFDSGLEKNFFFYPNVQTGCGAQKPRIQGVLKLLSPRAKRSEREFYDLPPRSAEIKKESNYTSIPAQIR
jgi:hypothetical protein